MTAAHGLASRSDAGAFLSRLVRLDAATVVRLRPVDGRVQLWAPLPWGVLVGRAVPGDAAADATVSAAALFEEVARGGAVLPPRRDADWRWPLPPPSGGRVVESVPADEVRRVAEAAAGTLRTASREGVGGRAVGQRALRDALLDHVPIVVSDGQSSVDVSQRLIQAVVRMGFLGQPDGSSMASIDVRVSGRWIGLVTVWGRLATARSAIPPKTGIASYFRLIACRPFGFGLPLGGCPRRAFRVPSPRVQRNVRGRIRWGVRCASDALVVMASRPRRWGGVRAS